MLYFSNHEWFLVKILVPQDTSTGIDNFPKMKNLTQDNLIWWYLSILWLKTLVPQDTYLNRGYWYRQFQCAPKWRTSRASPKIIRYLSTLWVVLGKETKSPRRYLNRCLVYRQRAKMLTTIKNFNQVSAPFEWLLVKILGTSRDLNRGHWYRRFLVCSPKWITSPINQIWCYLSTLLTVFW